MLFVDLTRKDVGEKRPYMLITVDRKFPQSWRMRYFAINQRRTPGEPSPEANLRKIYRLSHFSNKKSQ